MDIREKLQAVFRDIFDDEELTLREDMVADDVEGWDSLAHMRLLMAVEQAFGIKFSTVEVMRLKNVGEFMRLIQRKLG